MLRVDASSPLRRLRSGTGMLAIALPVWAVATCAVAQVPVFQDERGPEPIQFEVSAVEEDLMVRYLERWNEALTTFDSLIGDDFPDQPEETWDQTCDTLLAEIVDLRARLEVQAPAEEGLRQPLVDWLVDETEGASMICEEGRALAVAHNRVLNERFWVAEGQSEAGSVNNFLSSAALEATAELEQAVEGLTGDLGSVVSKIELGAPLTDAEERSLEALRSGAVSLLLLEPQALRVLVAAESRQKAFQDYVDELETIEEEISATAAQLPATLNGSPQFRNHYEEWMGRFLDQLAALRDDISVYESMTSSVRAGEFPELAQSADFTSFEDYRTRYSAIIERARDAVETIDGYR